MVIRRLSDKEGAWVSCTEADNVGALSLRAIKAQ